VLAKIDMSFGVSVQSTKFANRNSGSEARQEIAYDWQRFIPADLNLNIF